MNALTAFQAIAMIAFLIGPIVLYAWFAEGGRFAAQLTSIVVACTAWAFVVLYLSLRFIFRAS